MATVTVGCKLPNGFIIEAGDKRAVLAGANSSTIVGGHGITEGVDKDLWDAWSALHAELGLLKHGHIFAHEKTANTNAEAKDRADEKTGLEPIDATAKPAGLTELA